MPALRRTLPFALFLEGLAAASAAAQTEAWRVDGDYRDEALGQSIALVDDFDGDAVRDLLVGAPGIVGSAPTGRALLLSGSDLSLLREIAGPIGESFGAAVADAGDVDGDGVADFFVGSESPGVARVHSGATGLELLRLSSATTSDRFGAAGVGLGDVDGDGFGDIAIGAPGERVASVQVGVIRVVSGATGATLRRFDGSQLGARVGDVGRMASAGDFDGDGVGDLVYLDVEPNTPPDGVARIVSGATGLELFATRFSQDVWTFETVALVGDLDGDGIPDLAIGAMPVDPSANNGRVYCVSGATGAKLFHFNVASFPNWIVVGAAGDVDGDSVADVAVGATTWAGWSNSSFVMVASGAGGATIGSVAGSGNSTWGRSFAAGYDADGDGRPDLAVGESSAKRDNVPSGEVRVIGWPTGNLVARLAGNTTDRRFRGDIALLDDLDGDGMNDFAVADLDSLSLQDDALRIHSGRDGHLLLEHLLPIRPTGDLVAVPDLDGDGHDDLACGDAALASSAAVEVRSSATGALLLRIGGLPPSNVVLAVGIQPGGAVQLAIGLPGNFVNGEVQVWDLATGTLVFQRTSGINLERLGTDVAWLGDVNGDGVGDWAFGAPDNNSAGSGAGRVVVASGVAGALIKSLTGAAAGDRFGSAVAGPGDLDGDGRADLVAAAPDAGAGDRGEVSVYSSAGWTVMASVRGNGSNDRYGRRLDVLPDLNGDGLAEWLVLGATPGPHWDVRSGDLGSLMAQLPALSSQSSSTRVATPDPWQSGSANGDAHADALFAFAGDPPHALTQAWLIALDDLLLQIDPPIASVGDVVTAATRGGPAGGPVALELVATNGLPIRKLVDLGSFDVFGAWTSVDTIPPGLAGTTMEFRSWAIGFAGHLVDSPVQTLTLQ